MLALAAAALLTAWCDNACLELQHPLFSRWSFGAPELQYAFTTSTRAQRVHRFQAGWSVPLMEVLELTSGLALSTDGRLELVPGARWSIAKVGPVFVPAFSVGAPLALHEGVLQLHVRPTLELHSGLATVLLTLELDAAGRDAPRLWFGVQLSL